MLSEENIERLLTRLEKNRSLLLGATFDQRIPEDSREAFRQAGVEVDDLLEDIYRQMEQDDE